MSLYARIIARNLFFKKPIPPYFSQYRKFTRSWAPFLREIRARQKLLNTTKNHRNTYLDWNYDSELYAFGKRLGEEFDDSLLRRALTEHSYVNKLIEEKVKVGIAAEEEDSEESLYNAALALKGEEILEDVVVRYLRQMLPRLPEDGIQSIKKYLLSESTLSSIASGIGLTELILCQDFPVEDATHSRVFKAIISALHDSSGLERAAIFIRDLVLTLLAQTNVNNFWVIEKPVDLLRTICHNEGVSEPEPRLVGQCAVNTLLPLYRVAFYVDKKMIGLGPGETVEVAQDMAACDALWRLFGTAEHQLSIRFDVVVDLNSVSVPNVSADEWCEREVQKQLKVTA